VTSTRTTPSSAFVPTYVQRIKTRDRVVFLTIDDGVFEDPAFLALVRRQHLRFTVFLTNSEAGGKRAGYFAALQHAGAVIEDHTLTHPYLTRLSASARTHEVCTAARDDKLVFGRRAQLLRPPYGSWNAAVLATAKACGLHAVVGWDAVMPQTGQLQTWFGRPVLHPGDVVLMHFLPGMTGQVQRLEALVAAQHLRLALLEDYL
jgi:peptidoglycan/xylan/chitin deacetylase (PgdA/CDA1 family)